MKETIYIKLAIGKEDQEVEEIREAGLLFENIAEAAGLGSAAVVEIDETNYLAEMKNIQKKFTAKNGARKPN